MSSRDPQLLQKNRAFVFGVFNASPQQNESFLAFRLVAPRKTRIADKQEQVWNEQKLKQLEQARQIRGFLVNPRYRLAVPEDFEVGFAGPQQAVELGKSQDHPERLLEKLQVGSLTKEQAFERMKDARLLDTKKRSVPPKAREEIGKSAQPMRETFESPSDREKASRVFYALNKDVGVAKSSVRPCAIVIENPDHQTFSIVHVEHRSDQEWGNCKGLLGEITLLFSPYHNALD